jgi:proline dehydrogenase
VVGERLGDALPVCQDLARRGLSSTLGFWDSGNDSPESVANQYINAIAAIERHGHDCYVSVKFSALAFDSSIADEVVLRARRKQIRVHFDSLAPDGADRVFSFISSQLRTRGCEIGCTLPGRWQRSLQDAERAIDMGLAVRVVKGQWADDRQPEPDMRQGFLEVVDRLAGRARYVAVATHDPFVAERAMRKLRDTRTAFGLELLWGLPVRQVIRIARELQAPVRFYIPYGHAWLPYAMAQARKNPRILLWLMRDVLMRDSLHIPQRYPYQNPRSAQ